MGKDCVSCRGIGRSIRGEYTVEMRVVVVEEVVVAVCVIVTPICD